MGLSTSLISLLAEEGTRRPFAGKVMTLGRQTVKEGIIDPDAFFISLGFQTVNSLDYDAFDGATHALDLNSNDTPAELVGQYDVVLDSGTVEHIFRLDNALRHAIRLAKVGGRLIFITPNSNHMEHGFHAPSPMLFYEFLRANRLDIETIYVLRMVGRRIEAYDYKPGEWDDIQTGGLDRCPYMTFVVASKTAASTTDEIPQQAIYRKMWAEGVRTSNLPPAREWLKRQLSRLPRLYLCARSVERYAWRGKKAIVTLPKSCRAILTGRPVGLQNKRFVGRY